MSDRERAREIAKQHVDQWSEYALTEAIASALAQARAEGLRQAAEVALAEKMTGVPPLNWDASDLAIAEATVRATAKSIAARIRALAEGGE